MINLDPVSHSALAECLDHLHGLVPREPVVVWGEPGLGKTMMWRELARRKGMKFRIVNLNTMSPGDLRGMQFPDTKTQTSVQYPPDFLPKEDDPPTLLLFDELGTCPEMLRKPALELLLERRIGIYRLRDEDWCVGASNTGDDGVQTFQFDPATSDRFTHFLLAPNVKDWIRWAQAQGIDGRVIAFIESHEDEFAASLGSSDRRNDTIFPTPRSWATLSGILRDVEDVERLQPIIEGRVGSKAGVRFAAFCRNAVGHVAAGRILALPREKRLAAMPRKAAGLQSLAWSLPAHAVQSPARAKDCLHVACLLAKVQPKDGPGSKGFSREAASTAAHLMVERIGEAMPEALESEIALTSEFREVQKLLRIPDAPPKGPEGADGEDLGPRGSKAKARPKAGARPSGSKGGSGKAARPGNGAAGSDGKLEEASEALDAVLGTALAEGEARTGA